MNRPGAPAPTPDGFVNPEEWIGIANRFGLSLCELGCCALYCAG